MKIYYFLGMPIFKVVNRVTYVALENGVFGTLTVLENKLDMWSKKKQVAPKKTIDRGISNVEVCPKEFLMWVLAFMRSNAFYNFLSIVFIISLN